MPVLAEAIVKYPGRTLTMIYSSLFLAASWSGVGVSIGFAAIIVISGVFIVVWSKVTQLSEETKALSTKVGDLSKNVEEIQESLSPKVE